MRASRRTLRVTFAAVLALSAVAVPAITAGGAASASPVAGASTSHCSGHAVEVRQVQGKLSAKATLRCTGDIATMRVRTCLEMQDEVSQKWLTAKCSVKVKHRHGFISAVASRACPTSTDHLFRTRAFLLLKDTSGQKDRGKVLTPGKVFPRFC
jgi:hypothetical protein